MFCAIGCTGGYAYIAINVFAKSFWLVWHHFESFILALLLLIYNFDRKKIVVFPILEWK